MNIEQKLAAIKKINDQKDQVDDIKQRLDLDKAAMVITVNGIAIKSILPDTVDQELIPIVINRLKIKREGLILQAKELMK